MRARIFAEGQGQRGEGHLFEEIVNFVRNILHRSVILISIVLRTRVFKVFLNLPAYLQTNVSCFAEVVGLRLTEAVSASMVSDGHWQVPKTS